MDLNQKIAAQQGISKRKKAINDRIKPAKCILCGKPMGKTCNSHSIPQMVLKTISENGHYLNKNAVDNIDLYSSEVGTNNAGTFHYICRSCDGSYFSDYEDPAKIHSNPSTKMLGKIAIKNLLFMLQEKEYSKAFYKYDLINYPKYISKEEIEKRIAVFDLDIIDYDYYLETIRNLLDSSNKEFEVIFREVLPYVCPIAAQECFTIYYDRNGKMINDPELGSEKHTELVHLCVFPYEGKTTILLFYLKENHSYDVLKEQFDNSTEQENLKYINYYLLAYGENYFYSKNISDTLIKNELLKKISREYITQYPNFGYSTTIEYLLYTPVKYDEIPFLLGIENALSCQN